MKWISFIFIIFLFASCSQEDASIHKTMVVITIDDADESIYNTGLPILAEHGFPATFFINTAGIGLPGKLSWEQCEEMESVYGWEAGGHTLHHCQLPGLDHETAVYEIGQDWQNLVDYGLSHESFALPSGHATPENYEIITDYYENIRNSLDMNLHIPIDRTMLGYFVYDSDFYPDIVINRIIRGINNHEDLIILGFHRFYEDDEDYIDNCTPQQLVEIVEFLSDNEIEVVTIKEAMNRLVE